MSACSRCRSLSPNPACHVCREDDEAKENAEAEKADAARKEQDINLP